MSETLFPVPSSPAAESAAGAAADPVLAAPLDQPSHAAAQAWAQAHFPARSVESVTHSGWASTYRLTGSRRRAYLKIVPPGQASQLDRLADIARRFPGAAPRVLALEAARGWLLTQDHGGSTPDGDDDEPALQAVLRSFALLQAQAARQPAFLARFRAVSVPEQLDEFLAFLAAPAELSAQGSVGAAYFLGDPAARRYSRLFSQRVAALRQHLEPAQALAPTLAHGDLHSGNTALLADGRVCFIDWDEAAAGPAGLCLQGLFAGCAFASILLARWQAGREVPAVPQGLRLAAYVDTLVEQGYAPREQLLRALPGAMSAGQMRFITSFGRYPGERGRAAAADTLLARLSDLLDLCDWLDARQPETAQARLAAYTEAGEWRRALRLAQDAVARQPHDAQALGLFADLAWRTGDVATAEEAWQEALQHQPRRRRASAGAGATAVDARAAWHLGLARVASARLDWPQARAHLRKARACAADAAGAAACQALDERVRLFEGVQRAAARPKGWPRVPVTPAERAEGRLAPDTLALIVEQFTRWGAVQVDGVFELPYIRSLQAAFKRGYAEHFHDGEHAASLKVGDRRYMLTMRLDEVFGAPALVASPLLPFFHQVLGPECILSAYTAVVSLPGSEDQKIHKDHSALFEEAGWQLPHPSFAAQVIVPLLALDETTGATRVHKGSQRVPLKDADRLPYQDPVVPLGSCVLLDYSVSHYGRGNRSNQVRPILNLVYSRPWFRDCRNYYLQPPLRFDEAYLAQAPEAVRKLVDWWELERRAARHDGP